MTAAPEGAVSRDRFASEAGRLKLRAPAASGQTLVVPPWETAPSLVRRGRSIAAGDCQIGGRRLAELAELARGELLERAVGYSSAYRDVAAPRAGQPIVLAGHQPQLVHPGVWFKHFALARLAREQQAVAVNLVIDGDTLKSPSIRVPGGTLEAPSAENVAMDAPQAEIPFEQRTIHDAAMFASFGRRVRERLGGLVSGPMIETFWPRVLARARETHLLGRCLAEARHQCEGEWGLETLELPQSRLCGLQAFYWFTAHLLAERQRFREVYNAAVNAYRRARKIRSTHHPAPELEEVDGWVEAPFWLWSDDDPRRRRLFACRRGDVLRVSDRQSIEFELPQARDGDAAGAVEVLAEVSARGVCLRTRALTTTLFARLLGGDLFLHGIGGGLYDEVTDEIIRRFFGIEPPPYMVVTATLRLPVAAQAGGDDCQACRQRVRQLVYHPERFVDLAALEGQVRREAEQAISEKRKWVATRKSRDNAAKRHAAIVAANRQLAPLVAEQRQRWLLRSEEAARRAWSRRILSSREYAFCLFPETTLRDFLLAFFRGGI